MPRRQSLFSQPVMLGRVIVGLVGVIYGTLHYYRKVPEDLHAAVTFILLLFLVEQFFEIVHKFDRLFAGENKGLDINKYLAKDHGIIDELLKKTQKEISSTIELHDEGFKISHRVLAIFSYADFWELLTKEQEKRGKAQPLEIVAIHSCEMDIWDTHPLADLLFDRQQEVIKLGGRITRILCQHGPTPDPKCVKAYRNMAKAGIAVRYYDISSKLVLHTFGWDFLRIQATNQSAIWDSFSAEPGGVIRDTVYLNSPHYKEKEIDALWIEILKHSKDFGEEQSGKSAGA